MIDPDADKIMCLSVAYDHHQAMLNAAMGVKVESRPCLGCGTALMASKSSIDLIESGNAQGMVCFECLPDSLPNNKEEIQLIMAPGQQDEFRKLIRGMGGAN